jgi:hypothetical protein
MTREQGREFFYLMADGVLKAQRAEEETDEARLFVQRVSQRGAELAANILSRADYTYDSRTARAISEKVQALQLSDVRQYPDMPLLERPETARPADLCLLMERRAGYISGQPDMPPHLSRPYREDGAVAMMDILAGMLEDTDNGFQLDERAQEEIASMMRGFDKLYPKGLHSETAES